MRSEQRPCKSASLNIAEDMKSFTGELFFVGGLSGDGFKVFVTGSIIVSDDDEIVSWGICNESLCENNKLIGETSNGILFAIATFRHGSTANLKVQLNVGLSYISVSQAKVNFEDTSVSTMPFDTLVQTTKETWCDALSFVTFVPVDGDDDLETLLYSAAYRTLMSPTVYSEVGGVYMGLNQQQYNTDTREDIGLGPYSMSRLSDFSFWDTFRSLHPWLLLTKTDVAVGVLRSVEEMTVEQNAFPKWYKSKPN